MPRLLKASFYSEQRPSLHLLRQLPSLRLQRPLQFLL